MRSMLKASSLLIAGLALASCGTTKTIIEEVPVNVYVPVIAPCVADPDKDGKGNRPDRVKSIRDAVPREQWDALAPGAKAEAVRAQAGRRMNYEDEDRAATSACK